MNIAEQIEIMKVEARMANRSKGEGLRNWSPEARAKSLAVRQAAGSVWGWNKRQRATAPSYTSEGYDRSMEALEEDSKAVRRDLDSQRSGIPSIGPRSTYSDEMAAQRLESFKAWLAEVKRTETAIDDFNGIVAAAGGLMGAVGAQRGQRIGEVVRTPSKKAWDAEAKRQQAYDTEVKKDLERVRQEAIKESEAYLEAYKSVNHNPRDPLTAVDRVPGTRTALEKSIRRQFEKNAGNYLRKNPEDRTAMMDMVAEKADYYAATPAEKVAMEKEMYRQVKNGGAMNFRETPPPSDFAKNLEVKRASVREQNEVRKQLQPDETAYPVGNGIWVGVLPNGDERIIGTSMDPMSNRVHSAACASSKGQECNCSCGGSQHGGGSDSSDSSGGSTAEQVSSQANESHEKNGARGMTEEERLALIDELERKISEGKEPDGDAEEEMLADLKKASADWNKMVDGFRKMIEENKRPSLQNLIAQLKKDNDVAKYRMAVDALSEAYHTKSLDYFQDKNGRDPKDNEEFQDFQRKSKVPDEFIAAPSDTGSDNQPQQKTAVVAPVGKGRSMKDYRKLGFAGMDETWAGEAVRRIEEREKWGTKITADEARLVREYSAFVDAKNASRKVGK